MKKILSTLLAVCLSSSLVTLGSLSTTAQADSRKTMVIGDTTFKSENWE